MLPAQGPSLRLNGLRMRKLRILDGNGDVAIEEEDGPGVNGEFRSEDPGKPHAVLLPLVDHIEAQSRQIEPGGADQKRETVGSFGEHANGLEFRNIDKRLARPGEFLLFVPGRKGKVV